MLSFRAIAMADSSNANPLFKHRPNPHAVKFKRRSEALERRMLPAAGFAEDDMQGEALFEPRSLCDLCSHREGLRGVLGEIDRAQNAANRRR